MFVYGIVAFGIVVIGVAFLLFKLSRRNTVEADSFADNTPTLSAASSSSPVPVQNEAIANIHASIYRLAFGVSRVDYRIYGDHQQVLKAIEDAIPEAMREPRYFPRKPALLPKLLRAINSTESGRNEIVRLILQDAVLAGNVLKRANSVFYRQGQEVVESIDRAVSLMGYEGLRAPVASAVMQPVFQLPAGFFDNFAPITWEQARRTAISAEELARANRSADAFVAHLAGMLGSLARIVLFRLTHDKYRQKGSLMPRAEVFIRVMSDHGPRVARDIAAAWELSPVFVEALEAQIPNASPAARPPLATTVYLSNLCGALATLHCRGEHVDHKARELLEAQGMKSTMFDRVWQVAISSDIA